MNTAEATRTEDSPAIPERGILAAPPLDSSRIRYYARSFGDPIARLFWRDDRLWMGIVPPHGRAFAEIANLPLMEELVQDKLLVGLRHHAQSHAGFDAVYPLTLTPRITYWHEWSPKMLRTAALRLVTLLQKLAEHGLTLRNPHPWNLLYDGSTFVYMNPGSIVRSDPETFARSYEKVARFFIRPLLLIESGMAHLARKLIEDPREGVLKEDCEHVRRDWATSNPESEAEQILPFLDRLVTEVSCLNCNSGGGRWTDYFATDCDLSPGTSWSRKQQALEVLLEDREIPSVLDLGANTGHYARVAAERGREVIAADFDPALVNATFEQARNEGLSLYPVTMDFSHPTPGQGVDGAWFPTATERFASDLVLCFALSHHMVFGRHRLDFEQVARGVRSFSRRWALVEYVERGKIRPKEWRPDADAWYTADQLAEALRRHFPVVTVLAPANDGRQLLVCGPERRLV
jgi:SAM-dependent methyltransferase